MYLTSQQPNQVARPWCHSQFNDYCPLVISTMSFVILISAVLIVYICVRGSIDCVPLREWIEKLRKKMRKRRLTASRLAYNRTVQSTSAMSIDAPVNTSFFSRVNNFRHSAPDRNGQVWFTDISKTTRPPPTYEESQTQIYSVRNLVKPVPINPIIRTYPIQNGAFLVDNEVRVANVIEDPAENHEPTSTVLFPSYRCISLTSSPTARANLQRLGDLSRQLLEQHRATPFSRVGSLNIHNDEVPPAYDSIVSATIQEIHEPNQILPNHPYISNEYLI